MRPSRRSRRRSAPAGSRRSSPPASRRSCGRSATDPRGRRRRPLAGLVARRADRGRRATTSRACPAWGARRRRACCCSPTAGARCPVDTHVSRVGTRLGLLRAGAPFDELHDEMLALTPPGEELELHVNLLRHGRRTCHARPPACRRLRARAHVPEPGPVRLIATGSRGKGQPRGSTAKAITA